MDTLKIVCVRVAVFGRIPHLLTYRASSEASDSLVLGSWVEVPVDKRMMQGIVVDWDHEINLANPPFPIREISRVLLPTPLVEPERLKLYSWLSDYYQSPFGQILKSAFPKGLLKRLSLVSVRQTDLVESTDCIENNVQGPEHRLTGEQAAALAAIVASINKPEFQSFLLFGVTGSGKTEVYLQASVQALNCGKTALILVPEIALTPQLAERFRSRFGDSVAVLHSGLTEKQRHQEWLNIFEGRSRVVLGARSAIFSPLRNIGLVIVDEEHEPTYKQESDFRYHARDTAIVLAKLEAATVILGSATPSIETFYAASRGRHKLLELRERPKKRPMPEVRVVDMRQFKERPLLSPVLISAIDDLQRVGEQGIVLLNRKGFSSFLLCQDCGSVPQCKNCSVSLTFYQSTAQLKCHYCGYAVRPSSTCLACHSPEVRCMGYGTEAVELDLKDRFPSLKIGRLDAETAASFKKRDAILEQFRRQEIQVLVGTQMLAKGHDFPNVTLVGVALADQSLSVPDFRACERTFQLLTQVAGRAGRDVKPGRVIFQTYVPEHYAIRAAAEQNYQKFYDKELELRRDFQYPPFSRMALLEFRHTNEKKARAEASAAARLVQALVNQGEQEVLGEQDSKINLLGPSAASIEKIANKYRWLLLLRSAKSSALNAVMKTLRKEGVSLIDVDPVSTL